MKIEFHCRAGFVVRLGRSFVKLNSMAQELCMVGTYQPAGSRPPNKSIENLSLIWMGSFKPGL